MAGQNVLGDLLLRIIGDNSQLNSALNDSEKKTKQAAGNIDQTLKKVGESFTKVGKSLTVGLTLPIVGLGATFLKLADTQIQAETKLQNAINATGKQADISLESLKDYASGLQQVTTYGDEAQLSALALVQQLANLDENGLKAVLPGILDFSAAFGVDLQTAASLVGKTLGSSTNALSRYGIEIDTTASQTEKLAQLTEALEKRFGGAAETAAAAGLGPLKQLKNAAGDLAEQFGEILIPYVLDLVKSIQSLINKFSAFSEEQKRTILQIAGLAAAIGPALLVIGQMIKAVQALKIAMATLGAASGPVFLAVAAIGALVGGVALLVKHQQKLKEQKIAEEYNGMAEAVGLTSKEIRKLGDDFRVLNADEAASTSDILEIAKEQAEQTGKTVDEVLVLATAYDGINDKVKNLIKQTREQQQLERINADLANVANEQLQMRQDAHKKILDNLAAQRAEQERIADIERQQALKRQEFAELLQRIDALAAAGAINEEEALNRKIDIRKTEIDKIKEAAELGNITAIEARNQIQEQQNSVERYYSRLNELQNKSSEEIIDNYKQENEIAKQSSLERLRIEDERQKALQEKRDAEHKAELERIEEEKQARIQASQEAYGLLTNIFQQYYSNELSTLKAQKEAGKLTEEEYAKKVAEINQKQFRLNQATSAINATIAGAGAAIKAFEQLGPIGGAIAAVAIGGLTATQVGLILSQDPPPIPQFANGALTGVNQPVTAIVGDNKRYPEVVAPLSPEVFMGIADGIVSALYERTSSNRNGIYGINEIPGSGNTMSGGKSLYITQNNLLNLGSEEGLVKAAQTLYPYMESERVRRGE